MSLQTAAPTSIQSIEQRVAPLRQRLAEHPLYSALQSPEDLRIFMESHVFAVWDFMSLLKSLQRALTNVQVPWFPAAYPASCRFINEIVLAEESDQFEGGSLSHFEIYVDAMRRAGASTDAIERTVRAAKRCQTEGIAALDEALNDAPVAASAFVRTTFRVIREGSAAAQAAAFTFGREDALPDMFRSLVRDLNRRMSGDLTQFVWYLERHIEVDGEDHGPLSLRMVADLCGEDPVLWSEASQAAEDALLARLSLWDGILEQINIAT